MHDISEKPVNADTSASALFSGSDVGQKELDDKTALQIAAQFVETAAYNLAGQIDSGKVARLILISHELTMLSESLAPE